MTTWKSTSLYTVHKFEIKDAPDLRDTTVDYRKVISPKRVVLYQVVGTNLVEYACIEGTQVRRPTTLEASKYKTRRPPNHLQIMAGHSGRFRRAAPPDWLETILREQGLDWLRQVPQ